MLQYDATRFRYALMMILISNILVGCRIICRKLESLVALYTIYRVVLQLMYDFHILISMNITLQVWS